MLSLSEERGVLYGIKVCRRAYFGICIHIIAQQIPGLSRTKLTLQEFPGPGNFTKKNSRTFQEAWKPRCNKLNVHSVNDFSFI